MQIVSALPAFACPPGFCVTPVVSLDPSELRNFKQTLRLTSGLRVLYQSLLLT